MKFKKNSSPEPDINLIPFIDVLLVVLIFLMLTTTWSKFNEMNLSLPSSNASQASADPQTWVVSVNAQGQYAINGVRLEEQSPQALSLAFSQMKSFEGALLIKADASASHQSVVNVMEAARLNGLNRIAFATQQSTATASNKP
ncbi:MAG: Biopolymer transport protein ExbD [Pseudomonadota bacterium]